LEVHGILDLWDVLSNYHIGSGCLSPSKARADAACHAQAAAAAAAWPTPKTTTQTNVVAKPSAGNASGMVVPSFFPHGLTSGVFLKL